MVGVVLSRRLILVFAAVFAAADLFTVHVKAAGPDTDTKPVVTSVQFLYGTGGERAVMFQFEVKDIEKVQENKLLAEKLLPDAIAYAEARGLSKVGIRANQTTRSFLFGLFNTSRSYGYVWDKDPATGAWNEYVPSNIQKKSDRSAIAPAILYEEDPNDPQGKRAVGSVVWSAKSVSPGTGKPADLAVRADIEIPERKISITWTLQRDMEPNSPTSHTIEIMFKLPPDFPSSGIQNVPGIYLKQAEDGPPQTKLEGLSVKVTTGYFLIGLSAAPTDKERNIQLLKELPWFDIPIVYNNNRRALLAIEKGKLGERAFQQAFAAWNQ